jgi:geranylgeranyl diphosphate synthase type I
MDDAMSFPTLLRDVRTRVDERLAEWLAPRVAAAASISAEVGVAAEAARDLSLRGGKRMRAALVATGYDAFAGTGDCMPAMLAIELLQTYLLIHDDWMDDDDVRRGGPTVHVLLRDRLGDESLGDAAAILAGDLASGWAQEALLEAEASPACVVRAARAYAKINVDVVCGQLAEMTAERSAARPSVETVHALKTASYTVTGPLLVGASLAGATDTAGLERFGRRLGIAFQLRDDLLGTFGDPSATGKPIHNDIRQGKRTALVAELLRDASAAKLWASRDVDAIVRAMETSGAKARVESRVRELLDEARQALRAIGPSLTERGRALLEGAVGALGERSS